MALYEYGVQGNQMQQGQPGQQPQQPGMQPGSGAIPYSPQPQPGAVYGGRGNQQLTPIGNSLQNQGPLSGGQYQSVSESGAYGALPEWAQQYVNLPQYGGADTVHGASRIRENLGNIQGVQQQYGQDFVPYAYSEKNKHPYDPTQFDIFNDSSQIWSKQKYGYDPGKEGQLPGFYGYKNLIDPISGKKNPDQLNRENFSVDKNPGFKQQNDLMNMNNRNNEYYRHYAPLAGKNVPTWQEFQQSFKDRYDQINHRNQYSNYKAKP